MIDEARSPCAPDGNELRYAVKVLLELRNREPTRSPGYAVLDAAIAEVSRHPRITSSYERSLRRAAVAKVDADTATRAG